MEEESPSASRKLGALDPSQPMKELIWFSLISTSMKLLLIPSYHSTDFEVHRNWMATTHSLSLPDWYSDTTSPWTLDYPPFFAYFELFLSLFAARIDPTIVNHIEGLNYKANSVIYFQRITVMVSDLVLHYAIYRITRNLESNKRRLIWVLVIWSPALLIVDHMHFQYNGFLLGLLLISISGLMEGNDLVGGFFFAVLLCFKHLFAVAAPVYFVYLLRHYCRGGWIKGFRRLFGLGMVVVLVFAAAFGPFVYHDQMLQVIHRMFPFGRGLCHAYWAPNFWVFYIMADKLLAFILRRVGFNVQKPAGSFTSGLVGDSSPFSVLPQITPLVTFMMVLLAISPCLFKAWKNPQPRKIARWIAYAYSCGFIFGWHVHEKATLHFLIPMAVTAIDSISDARHYFLLSVVACYSLFPLLFEVQEYPIKVTLLLLHCVLMWYGFSSFFSGTTTTSKNHLQKKNDDLRSDENLTSISEKGRLDVGWVCKSYLLGFLAVELWGQFLHPLILRDELPFLPLLLVSVYSAFGIMYSWIWQLKWIVLYC
ncbi:probable dolichyl pyrophosphate Glc1Man9GlcNAc2 alpha-1,3-glucosyltransferase [Beta vulgaris subsp. vulgaris]|uniref:probable dolichyl pyrophosphate Glc1Man9GlcNAc2 alpha-1,3-glucosyltransferase n=1 Tax=Beta vulgaris subsp. vulgaris TaxID=3555 RepID=UPI002036BEB7|nr:probable dolichyl pyrophosphate Glc1Man9GlcNAc2 alpha-1,3-glucosyltransferase [Beta vulgaris subsp. vulgaris]